MSKNTLKTIRFIFDKWDDTPVKRKYDGFFYAFESEVRNTPECPEIFRWIPTIWFESGSNLESEEGLILEATYYSDQVTPEDIEKFFKDYKIHVHRAEPFFVDRQEDRSHYLKFIERAKKTYNSVIRNEFIFRDPGKLIDKDLELVLVKETPAIPEIEHVPAYTFEMRLAETGEKIGEINLRIGFNENIYYGGNISYSVSEKFRGNRYAARSCKLLFPFAKKHGTNPLWITCVPKNTASRKTCELAGGKLIEIVDLPHDNEQYKTGIRQKCRYRFDL